ncbi:unnamed protein product, partial [Medioppia subpectinata]
EWILNDAEKEIRKIKIEENRKSKDLKITIGDNNRSKPMDTSPVQSPIRSPIGMAANDCQSEAYNSDNNSNNATNEFNKLQSKKYMKICSVCGEKAIGYNFCAITCESCKAFFRRNATKIQEYKCPFDDKCKVDIKTRKFCRRCRLRKCYAVGMKQEWILNEEEKEIRRHKIEENRRCRQVNDGNSNHSNTSNTSGYNPPPNPLIINGALASETQSKPPPMSLFPDNSPTYDKSNNHNINNNNYNNISSYNHNNNMMVNTMYAGNYATNVMKMMDQTIDRMIRSESPFPPTAVKVSVIKGTANKCPFDNKCMENEINKRLCRICCET